MKKIDLDQSKESTTKIPEQLQPTGAELTSRQPARIETVQPGIDKTNQIGQDQNSSIQETEEPEQEAPIFNQLNLEETAADMKKRSKKLLIVMSLTALIAGTGTGIGAYRLQVGQEQLGQEIASVDRVAEGRVKKGDVFGVQDESTFRDSAEGYLEIGGLNGEGSHKLLRPGGESQTVYLTSTVTDLDRLANMEVKVWGETYKGQKAGWLMDVGKIEVLDPNAEPPIEAEL